MSPPPNGQTRTCNLKWQAEGEGEGDSLRRGKGKTRRDVTKMKSNWSCWSRRFGNECDSSVSVSAQCDGSPTVVRLDANNNNKYPHGAHIT